MLNIVTQNGMVVSGPAEEWLAAIMLVLPTHMQDSIFSKIEHKHAKDNMKPNHYVLKCEGGHMDITGKGLGRSR